MIKVLICVDDTDDLTKKTSTGLIAQLISDELQKLGGTLQAGVSRHQLLLCEDINYTSHNSAMCFEMDFASIDKQSLIETAINIINANKAETSEPGLAVCYINEISNAERLINFGFLAKQRVILKDEAYIAAREAGGVTLTQLGGEGRGIIGALAGIGLRLSRCDGSLRGKLGKELGGRTLTAIDICSKLNIEAVADDKGNILPDDSMVCVKEYVKPVFFNGKLCALAERTADGALEIRGESITERKDKGTVYSHNCEKFVFDNDENERLTLSSFDCFNCLFRRWTADGFECLSDQVRK